jgi:hypothetical protein
MLIKDNKLKYYSLFAPFGKTLNFSNYIGKIITSETGSDGSYKVIYLVDKLNRTSFKIMGVLYKNIEEIDNGIPLKKINYTPVGWEYFKLLFTGKVNVLKSGNKSGDKKKNTSTERIIRKTVIVVVSIGLLLFVLGTIVKIISKLT